METLKQDSMLTRREAAKYLGKICLTTLSRLDIPHVQIRRRIFYRVSDLNIWLEKHTVTQGANRNA
jgi:hypothetical protein